MIIPPCPSTVTRTCAVLMITLFVGLAQAGEPATGGPPAATADQVLKQASSNGAYTLLCLWQGDTAEMQAFRKGFAEAAAKEAKRAVAVEVQADAPANAELIRRLQLERAPKPLALAIAPNGAVTRGYPQLPPDGFASAFVGPSLASCVKVTQEGKLAVVVFTNAKTREGEATLAAANAFVAQATVKDIAGLVSVDPAAPVDADLCSALKIVPDTDVATVALLAPPGRMLGTFRAPVTKEQLDAALAKAMSGGCGTGSSCGPSGCP
jgi:hypothetical protein